MNEPEIPIRCSSCDAAARHAYSDAATPGFFYDKCEYHRMKALEAKVREQAATIQTLQELYRRAEVGRDAFTAKSRRLKQDKLDVAQRWLNDASTKADIISDLRAELATARETVERLTKELKLANQDREISDKLSNDLMVSRVALQAQVERLTEALTNLREQAIRAGMEDTPLYWIADAALTQPAAKEEK